MAEPFAFAAGPFVHWVGVLRRIRIRLMFRHARQIEFLETLIAFNEDGISLPQAVSFIAETGAGVQKTLASHIERQFRRGRSLADGLVDYYPAYIVEGIRGGEAGGSLGDALGVSLDHLRETGHLGADFAKQMAYPGALVAFICILLGHLHGTLFMPLVAGREDMAQLPEIFVFYHTLSGWLATWGLLLPVALVAMVGVVWLMLIRMVGFQRDFLDTLPVFKHYRMMTAARLLTSIGTLMLSGVAFRDAVRILRRSGSRYVAMHLARILDRLARGIDLGSALDTGLLASVDAQYLRLLARSSRFDRALITCGKRVIAILQDRLTALALVLRYVAMATIALLGIGIYFVVLNINTIVAY